MLTIRDVRAANVTSSKRCMRTPPSATHITLSCHCFVLAWSASGGLTSADRSLKRCLYAPNELARRFIECFVDNADPFVLNFIRAALQVLKTAARCSVGYGLIISQINQSDDDILENAIFNQYLTADCLPEWNVDLSVQSHWYALCNAIAAQKIPSSLAALSSATSLIAQEMEQFRLRVRLQP